MKMETITINVADYYGIPSYYSVMPESIFVALETAFVNGETTATVPLDAFTHMRDSYIKRWRYENISPETIAIQQRFFVALNWCVDTGVFTGLQEFCQAHGLNRTKYARIRNNADGLYKCIDVDALAHICRDGAFPPIGYCLGKGKWYAHKPHR